MRCALIMIIGIARNLPRELTSFWLSAQVGEKTVYSSTRGLEHATLGTPAFRTA